MSSLLPAGTKFSCRLNCSLVGSLGRCCSLFLFAILAMLSSFGPCWRACWVSITSSAIAVPDFRECLLVSRLTCFLIPTRWSSPGVGWCMWGCGPSWYVPPAWRTVALHNMVLFLTEHLFSVFTFIYIFLGQMWHEDEFRETIFRSLL